MQKKAYKRWVDALNDLLLKYKQERQVLYNSIATLEAQKNGFDSQLGKLKHDLSETVKQVLYETQRADQLAHRLKAEVDRSETLHESLEQSKHTVRKYGDQIRDMTLKMNALQNDFEASEATCAAHVETIKEMEQFTPKTCTGSDGFSWSLRVQNERFELCKIKDGEKLAVRLLTPEQLGVVMESGVTSYETHFAFVGHADPGHFIFCKAMASRRCLNGSHQCAEGFCMIEDGHGDPGAIVEPIKVDDTPAIPVATEALYCTCGALLTTPTEKSYSCCNTCDLPF